MVLLGFDHHPCIDPQNVYHVFEVERLLSITASKSIIIYKHNNTKLGQLSQKHIFLVADMAAC